MVCKNIFSVVYHLQHEKSSARGPRNDALLRSTTCHRAFSSRIRPATNTGPPEFVSRFVLPRGVGFPTDMCRKGNASIARSDGSVGRTIASSLSACFGSAPPLAPRGGCKTRRVVLRNRCRGRHSPAGATRQQRWSEDSHRRPAESPSFRERRVPGAAVRTLRSHAGTRRRAAVHEARFTVRHSEVGTDPL